MSAHEFLVEWPAYDAAKAEMEKILRDLEGTVSPEEFDREHERMEGGG